MSNIYKLNNGKSTASAQIDHDALEEFPAKIHPEFKLPPVAAEEPEEIVEEVNPELERRAILAQAWLEAESIQQNTYEEGLRLGEDSGRETFLESVGHSSEVLAEAGAAMKEAREVFLESLEGQVVELAVLIAERVLEREASTDRELLQRTVRRALAKIADRQKLRVQVHPDDAAAMREHRITLLEEFDGAEEIEVEVNEAVTLGGCIVESELMQVDARLETLLANVLEELKDPGHASD